MKGRLAVLGLALVTACGSGSTTSGAPQGLKAVGGRVSYVDHPRSDPSDKPVAVAGSAFLQVVLLGLGFPLDTGVPKPTVRRLPATGVVREVVLDGGFEGYYTSFVGVRATLPFRVFRLTNPARVVVDVRRS